MIETRADRASAVTYALLLHLGLAALFLLSARWTVQIPTGSAAGPPIEATLQVSSADIRRAQQAIKQAQAKSPPPQPLPAPRPQTSDTPLQPKPQAPQTLPDKVDQERIDPLALQKAEKPAPEQEEKHRQEQVDLTEDIARQDEAERRQRLREQLDAIRQERDQASRQTLMEQQRLQQIADRQQMMAPAAKPTNTPPQPVPSGNNGRSTDLAALYIQAMNQTARSNWNTAQVPQGVPCRVSFTQIPGGEVINVEFSDCPYDSQGRESVERALRKTPMPYSGYEPVFQRQVSLTMCYPQEACQR